VDAKAKQRHWLPLLHDPDNGQVHVPRPDESAEFAASTLSSKLKNDGHSVNWQPNGSHEETVGDVSD
jgi:hypothetical protein